MEGIILALVYLFLFFSIMLDAFSDAFIDETGNREHKYETLSILMLMVSFVIFDGNDVLLIPQYIIMRSAFFNILYNNQRGISLSYLGSTDWYDKLWKMFPKWFYTLFVISMVVVSLLTIIFYLLWVQ
jgi:hypothetical protein